jgi:hypothetical protein
MKKHLITLIACVGALILLIVVLILPSIGTMEELDQEIGTLERDIERQRILQPLYKDIKAKLAYEPSDTLPNPMLEKLDQEQIEEYLYQMLSKAAANAGLATLDVTPEPESVKGTGLLRVNFVTRGGFEEFRQLLIELGENPYFRHIEEVNMEEVFGTIEYRMNLWLAAQGA